MLWNSTMMKKHWRSVISANSTLASPVVAGSMTPEISTALRFGGNNFWVTAGGAINPDGGAVGTFPTDEDFLIRGGRIGIRFTNLIDSVATTQETIHVYAYLIRTGRGYNPGVLPTSVPIGWDPSMLTDFGTTVGRIVLQKQFLLEDRNSASLEYRIPIQKIDASDYAAGRNTWVWLYMVGNADSNASRSMGVYPYYNLSFTADQV